MKKIVIVAGKGILAIEVADWFLHTENYDLSEVVPVVPEPDWCDSLSKWGREKKVSVIKSGDHRKCKTKDVDLFVSVFYDKIIKKDFIDSCRKIINIHNGPLPLYRGVRPINWALKNKESSHGVTIHEITPGIDDGPIYGQVIYPIYPEEEVEDVYLKSLGYAFALFSDVISKIDLIDAVPQRGDSSYYSIKDDARLGDRNDWRRTREE